jgi:FAD:protein FMN transferase
MISKRMPWLICILLIGCAEPTINKCEGFEQGTTFHISYWSERSVDGKALEEAVNKTFADIDKTLSNYRPDSAIEQFNINLSTQSQAVGEEIVALVKLASQVSQASQGCYDLTIKPLFDLWGFKADELNIPDDATLQKVLSEVGMDKLEIVDTSHLQKKQPHIRVDVSSVAQGYSVGRISQVLEQFGIDNYLVEIGGELKTNGHKPNGQAWRIAVEKPLPGEQRLHKIIALPVDKPTAVMTSGTYRHYFDRNGRRYSHILDARNGQPVNHDLVAVTVLHNDPTVADAWSTALLCLGQQQGMQLANAEKLQALFIRQQGNELLETKSDALLNSGLSIE